jgi:hypothetical protein
VSLHPTSRSARARSLLAGAAIAAALACGRPAAAPAQGRDAGVPVAGDDLAAAVRAFPRGETAYFDAATLSSALKSIVSDGGPADVAFAIDMATAGSTRLNLQLAVGAARASLAGRGRFALVSCVNDGGVARARIDSPFSDDPYQVLRAARHMDFATDIGRPAFWSCLAELDRLAWGAPAPARRYVVLLADDAPGAGLDPKARGEATGWARSSRAELRVFRPGVPEIDAATALYEPKRYKGVALAELAGLFRLGSTAVVHGKAELAPAIERALAQAAGSPGAADVVLAVDRSGEMGAALGDLQRARSVFERFLSASGHRLALITWGDGRPTIAARLTDRPAAIAAALAATKRGPLGDWPKYPAEAVGASRGLAWDPKARRTVVVLTAATAFPPAPAVLDWTDEASVGVVFIQGGQGF